MFQCPGWKLNKPSIYLRIFTYAEQVSKPYND